MPPALFALVILFIEPCVLPKPAWIMILLLYASHGSWDDRHTAIPSVFSIEMGAPEFYSLGWP
jgi:hypothetical protein